MADLIINIARDFSKTPGPRTKAEGAYSAEEFLESILLIKFKEAKASGRKLTIILDGTAGFATSFLEGAFGELARRSSQKEVKGTIEFISEEEPYLLDEINQYIKNA